MKKKFIIAAALLIISVMLFAGCVKEAAAPETVQASPGSQTFVLDASKFVDLRNTISISAEGEVKPMPDVAYITLGVISQNTKLAKANEDNKTKMDAIYKALNDKGITKENIKTASYYQNINYDWTSGKRKIVGYEVVHNLELTVNDIESVGDIIDACYTAGANNVDQPRFDLKDKTSAYNEALKAAIEKAKAKAELIANTAGVTLAGMMRLDESYSSYAPRYEYAKAEMQADSSAAPSTQISAGEMTITANVNIVYEIK